MTNVEEAMVALTQKPLKSTSFQRIKLLGDIKNECAGLSQPLAFSKAMRYLLENVDTPVCDNDVIVGRYVDKVLTQEEEEYFQAFVADRENLYHTTIFETGHCTLDWEDLIKSGLPGLKARAEKSLEKHKRDKDKKIFLEGAIGFYDAVISFVKRYAVAAEKAGKSEIAAALEAIATRAPQSFFEGVQLWWMVAFIDCAYVTANPTLSLGRPDVFLYSLYKKDKARGITDERMEEIITDYYCKHNLIMGRGEHQLGDASNTTGWDRILNFDAPQYMHLAGTDKDGLPAVNELTLLFASCIRPGLKNPVTVVRYYEGMADEHPKLWRVLMQKAMESCSLMFYNDNDVISAFRKVGVPLADAREYEHFGCNWAGLGKNSCWMLSAPRSPQFSPDASPEEKEQLKVGYHRTRRLNGWTQDFMEVARELNEKSTPPQSIDEFYSAFNERVKEFVLFKLENMEKELLVRNRHPSAILTVGDCFRVPPIEKATANNASAAKWHFQIQTLICFASLVDLFITVDRLVFRDKKYTLSQLFEAVDANFDGYPQILAACRKVKKFGSDDELSNYHAARVLGDYLDIVQKASVPYAEKYGIVLMPSIQSDTHNVRMGAASGATFDGRLAGEAFSQNSRPSFGSCVNGITGMLSSLMKLPMRGLASGSLNLDIQPKDFHGEEGAALLGSMIKTYLDGGGLHVQVSCQNVEDFIDAQIHPEKHRDLMVRVTGYSGIFVDFSKQVQDYVIERMKQ